MDSDAVTDIQKKVESAYMAQLGEGQDGLSQRLARDALFQLQLNPTGLEVAKCWTDMGKKEDDVMTLGEFEKLRCMLQEDTETVMRWAFNKFDVNNDGTIDKDELKKILVKVYDDEAGDLVDDDFVEHVLTMADVNNDGVLQIEEFVDMIMERTGRSTSRQSSSQAEQPSPP